VGSPKNRHDSGWLTAKGGFVRPLWEERDLEAVSNRMQADRRERVIRCLKCDWVGPPTKATVDQQGAPHCPKCHYSVTSVPREGRR
jgi:uncharacterized paraquat-inducible protein A